MSRSQIVYLRDILDRIRRIENYTSLGEDKFLDSEVHQDGVIRSFEVIGEIVKRLDVELLEQHPEIEWGNFAGFRDVLIHQ
ncbi:MAG: HepT-like ribonuclease domain-containing protein [Anaerolineae bacterium]